MQLQNDSDNDEISYTCNICNSVKLKSFVELSKHEKECSYIDRCLSARNGKKNKKIKVVKAKNKICTTIDDHYSSSKQSGKKIQIGNEVFPLLNVVSLGPIVPVSDYFSPQRFKFSMSFSDNHLLKPWESFAETREVAVDPEISKDLKFYSEQLETGDISLTAGENAIKRILNYRPSSFPPQSWRSTKFRVEGLLQNFRLVTHIFSFPPEWKIPTDIPSVSVQVRDVLDIVACVLADPKLQNSNEFYLETYKVLKGKRGETGGCDHIMSSSWARKSFEKIKRIDKNGFLVPIILYEDGITVDSAGVRSIDSIVLTLGNYSKQARSRDFSKFHVGFVPKIFKSSTIINLLKDQFGKTKGAEMFKLFKLQIHRDIYRLILSTIKQVSQEGIF